jgi:HAD superfamily hydrolase (TIGR01509 family)
MHSIGALIFDMDGLMVDTERLYIESEHTLAERYGKELSDATIARMMGRKPIEAVSIFVQDLGIPADPASVLAERDVLMERAMRHDLAPMPGLFSLLDAFDGRLAMAIATGAPQQFLDIVVDTLGIRERFNILQSSDTVSCGKPHPEIYLRTTERLGLPPAACLVLEDSHNGIIAAKEAECLAAAIPNEYTRGQDFSRADHIAVSLAAVIPWIEQYLPHRV